LLCQFYAFLCIVTSNAQIGLVNAKFPEHGLLANQIFTHRSTACTCFYRNYAAIVLYREPIEVTGVKLSSDDSSTTDSVVGACISCLESITAFSVSNVYG